MKRIWAFTLGTLLAAQTISWTREEKPVGEEIARLRSLPDDARARATKEIAIEIRGLKNAPHRVELAEYLASRATEGDFGRDTLQAVTDTLAAAVNEKSNARDSAYDELAQLVRYEHMQASIEGERFRKALARLEAEDAGRERADFTLKDIRGQAWTLSALKGRVVLVNFWATWCPPCRKEIPDLNTLYQQFKDRGLVILGLDDEEIAKVRPFVAEQKMLYPVLLDPGRKVNKSYKIEGIPKTFVYDRQGKMVAESIDMRTRSQFLAMLAEAGLK